MDYNYGITVVGIIAILFGVIGAIAIVAIAYQKTKIATEAIKALSIIGERTLDKIESQ